MSTTNTTNTNNNNNKTMKALVIYDRPFRVRDVSQNLDFADVPLPQQQQLKPHHVLVKVHAASLQLEDLYTAIGRRPLLSITPTPTQPVTLGIEFTGKVVAVVAAAAGNDNDDSIIHNTTTTTTVPKFHIGERVMGFMTPIRVKHGCWAQYVSVHENNLVQVPSSSFQNNNNNWSNEQAAAFGMSSLVAQAATLQITQQPFSQQQQQQQQQRVAVVGASGTIGSLLVTLLASMGNVHVVAVCSENHAEFCMQCGAHQVHTREMGGLATYRASDDGRRDKPPLDYVFDCVGGDRIEQDASKALKQYNGHFVTVVGPGEEPFGGSDSTGGVGRGAFIAAKALRAKLRSGYSYTLVSMKPIRISSKLESVATAINQYTNGKGPHVRTRTVPVNDMTAVRAAMDDVARHASNGRVILDFTVLDKDE